jgi:hypothetical protein
VHVLAKKPACDSVLMSQAWWRTTLLSTFVALESALDQHEH